jgi:hypothetical protein
MSSNPIVCERIKLRLGKNKKNSRALKYQVKKQLDLNFLNTIDSTNPDVSNNISTPVIPSTTNDLDDDTEYNFKSLSRIPEEYIVANSPEELESLILTILNKPTVREILSVIIGDEISQRISRGDIAIRIDNTTYNKNGIVGVSNASTKPIHDVQETPVQPAQPAQPVQPAELIQSAQPAQPAQPAELIQITQSTEQ